MRIEGQGKLLRVHVGESDTWHGKPLYHAIVERVRAEGLAGATVTAARRDGHRRSRHAANVEIIAYRSSS